MLSGTTLLASSFLYAVAPASAVATPSTPVPRCAAGAFSASDVTVTKADSVNGPAGVFCHVEGVVRTRGEVLKDWES